MNTKHLGVSRCDIAPRQYFKHFRADDRSPSSLTMHLAIKVHWFAATTAVSLAVAAGRRWLAATSSARAVLPLRRGLGLPSTRRQLFLRPATSVAARQWAGLTGVTREASTRRTSSIRPPHLARWLASRVDVHRPSRHRDHRDQLLPPARRARQSAYGRWPVRSGRHSTGAMPYRDSPGAAPSRVGATKWSSAHDVRWASAPVHFVHGRRMPRRVARVGGCGAGGAPIHDVHAVMYSARVTLSEGSAPTVTNIGGPLWGPDVRLSA